MEAFAADPCHVTKETHSILPTDGPYDDPEHGPGPDRRAAASDPALPPTPGIRRKTLHLAARLAPEMTARILARRYLSTPAHVDHAHIASRPDISFHAFEPDTAILRHAPRGEGNGATPRRILVAPGHDGHYRQFSRLVRALQNRGAEVDVLIMPGHLEPPKTVCSLRDFTVVIREAAAQSGPYDGLIAHCVSCNGALLALAEGLSVPRMVFISTPVYLDKLVAFAGRQYGLTGHCLHRFVHHVSRLGDPYPLNAPWQPIAETRDEPLLLIHASDDWAAPAEDLKDMQGVWKNLSIQILDHGDHNTILNVTSAIRGAAEFMTAQQG